MVPEWAVLVSEAQKQGWSQERRSSAPFRARERHFEGTALSHGSGSLVLWRDNFGWCPFCLPTQLLLEEKRIPYTTRKVPLKSYMYRDKPVEFSSRVANGLVPDLTRDFGTSKEHTEMPVDGFDLLPWIEENFPDASPMAAPCEVEDASYHRLSEALQGAISEYYNADEEPALCHARTHLLVELRELELALARHPEGPYLFGEALTLPDLRLIPWLERCDAVPRFFKGEELLGDAFPLVRQWLAALRGRDAYKALRLDEESLMVSQQNATAFFKGVHRPFNLVGGASIPGPDPQAGPAAERGAGSAAAVEAAHSLVHCRDGVMLLAGAPPVDTAASAAERMSRMGETMRPGAAVLESESAVATDQILRYIAASMLEMEGSAEANDALLRSFAGNFASEVAAGLMFLRNRVQVPRDMSAPAGATLRDALLAAAVALVGESAAFQLFRSHEGPYMSRRDIRSRY